MTYKQQLRYWRLRRERIRKLYADGWTLRALAAKFRVKYQRVQQIVKP